MFVIHYHPDAAQSEEVESVRDSLRKRGWDWSEEPDESYEAVVWPSVSLYCEFDGGYVFNTTPSDIENYLKRISYSDGVWRLDGRTREEYDRYIRSIEGAED